MLWVRNLWFLDFVVDGVGVVDKENYKKGTHLFFADGVSEDVPATSLLGRSPAGRQFCCGLKFAARCARTLAGLDVAIRSSKIADGRFSADSSQHNPSKRCTNRRLLISRASRILMTGSRGILPRTAQAMMSRFSWPSLRRSRMSSRRTRCS